MCSFSFPVVFGLFLSLIRDPNRQRTLPGKSRFVYFGTFRGDTEFWFRVSILFLTVFQDDFGVRLEGDEAAPERLGSSRSRRARRSMRRIVKDENDGSAQTLWHAAILWRRALLFALRTLFR